MAKPSIAVVAAASAALVACRFIFKGVCVWILLMEADATEKSSGRIGARATAHMRLRGLD